MATLTDEDLQAIATMYNTGVGASEMRREQHREYGKSAVRYWNKYIEER